MEKMLEEVKQARNMCATYPNRRVAVELRTKGIELVTGMMSEHSAPMIDVTPREAVKDTLTPKGDNQMYEVNDEAVKEEREKEMEYLAMLRRMLEFLERSRRTDAIAGIDELMSDIKAMIEANTPKPVQLEVLPPVE